VDEREESRMEKYGIRVKVNQNLSVTWARAHFANYFGTDMCATICMVYIRWRKLILNDLLP
jgi:hypothetical protein